MLYCDYLIFKYVNLHSKCTTYFLGWDAISLGVSTKEENIAEVYLGKTIEIHKELQSQVIPDEYQSLEFIKSFHRSVFLVKINKMHLSTYSTDF